MSSLRKLSGFVAKRFLFKPPFVNCSVQTIYKSLQGCIYLYELSKNDKWAGMALDLVHSLSSIQIKQGGYDVGYNYPIGSDLLHKRGFPLACETTATLVLGQYKQVFNSNLVDDEIAKDINWIISNAINTSNDEWAIPYDPSVTKEIAIINGTSFSASALGTNINSYNKSHQKVYEGMITFLLNKMEKDPSKEGKFWRYFDQTWTGIPQGSKLKTDYYHQAQQIEVHAITQLINPLQTQKEIVENGADHLVSIHNEFGLIPYDNDNFFDGKIHSWGLSSIIPAMIEAGKIIPSKKYIYHNVAHQTMEWLLKYSWNGSYFYDILTPEGRPISFDYMVRSDAWCFQACTAYTKEFGKGYWEIAALKCFNKMNSVNFSGYEKHGKRKLRLFIERFQQMK